MSKRKKKLYAPLECPACLEVHHISVPPKYVSFSRTNEYEETRERMLGYPCQCGYMISKQGMYFRNDLEVIWK